MKSFLLILLFSIFNSLSAEQKTKLEEKFENIQISGTQFFEAPLPEVLIELQRLSKQFDLTEANPLEKGVQFVYKSLGSDSPPKITLSLSPMSLKNSVRMICEMIGWHYHLAENRIIISKFPHDLGKNPLRNKFYEVTQGSLNRMIGVISNNKDPFAPPKSNSNDPAIRLKEFFQNNGIIFETSKGHKFAFDGFQIIATHDKENLSKIESLLREHDYDIPPQISVTAILIEAPTRSLAKYAKALNLSREDTEGFPFISTNVANQLINLMQESEEVKILHNPSTMVLDGKKMSINSGKEYRLLNSEESFVNSDNVTPNQDLHSQIRNIGLTIELTPRLQKYQVIEIDLLSEFTRLVDDHFPNKGRSEPTFWSSRTNTSIQIGPGQTFISVASSSIEGFKLISFLSTEVKR